MHWSKPYLLLSATCDEILSWLTEVCMKNHLVSDFSTKSSKCLQRMANNVGLTFSVVDIIP